MNESHTWKFSLRALLLLLTALAVLFALIRAFPYFFLSLAVGSMFVALFAVPAFLPLALFWMLDERPAGRRSGCNDERLL